MSSRRRFHRTAHVVRVPLAVFQCIGQYSDLKVHYAFRIDLPYMDFSEAVKKWRAKA